MFRRLGIGVLFLGLRAIVHGLRLRLPQTVKPSNVDVHLIIRVVIKKPPRPKISRFA